MLALLAVTAAAAVGLFVKMLRKDEPLFGGLGLCLLVGPGALLAFAHAGLTEF
ncbi:hypothetical protein M8542_40370 [Amycolatopsis sp. OK19-0408]|uniref:Uncharacterized protein n=1 Tax=Amycolatopsis iheyensis TaxID=2945988 RepID=A0A9X2SNQ6_9PSEU|nr:hypothetical protein [Amycolatopsis iheyensis]MCR6489099.1 hypothetical protein [Amycolatopsis iheyensis]